MPGKVVQQFRVRLKLRPGHKPSDLMGSDYSGPSGNLGFVSDYDRKEEKALVTLYQPMMTGVEVPNLPVRDMVRTELSEDEMRYEMEKIDMVKPGYWARKMNTAFEESAAVLLDETGRTVVPAVSGLI